MAIYTENPGWDPNLDPCLGFKGHVLVGEYMLAISYHYPVISNHICLLQITKMPKICVYMVIYGHLYLKSGLGPYLSPKSRVERPQELKTWAKLIFITFLNIFH